MTIPFACSIVARLAMARSSAASSSRSRSTSCSGPMGAGYPVVVERDVSGPATPLASAVRRSSAERPTRAEAQRGLSSAVPYR